MKRLYFSIILGLAPVFSLNPARGEQPAPTEHKHEDGTACTADHGHEDHQHKEGETCAEGHAMRNTSTRTAPSAQATTSLRATSMQRGKPARATTNMKRPRRKVPASRGT